MGARKRIRAEQRKEENRTKGFAILRNNPTSPRKTRLMTDLIQGMDVQKALDVLKFSDKESARKIEKLLLSAIANWQAKNEGTRIEDTNLYVKEVFVDQSKTLKRLQPAPQGRAHRIKKRSNHITIILGTKNTVETETKN
jgi:large subunit ribosomal protein L22